MPTGYTAGVVDGKVADFQTFALQCARAFGALILMRDDRLDADIPQAFEPSTFHAQSASRGRLELARLQSLGTEQVLVEYAAFCDEVRAENFRRQREADEVLARIENMQAAVEAWQPPTSEHSELKNFMRQQLQETLKYDGRAYSSPLPENGPSAWHSERIATVARGVAADEKYQAEENERTAGRNKWVTALRESLR